MKKGNDNIIKLHDKLYSRILESFLFSKVTYCPHLIVGRLNQEIELDKALDELRNLNESFEIIIDKIYIENIDSMEHSTIEFSFDLEQVFNIRKVIIDTFFQGQGIGSALIKDCLEYAKEHNVRKIFLWVLEKNYNARKVYEKFGFKADDVTKFEDGTTELLLRYKLEM